ncbi:hypothetical protein COR50_14800 [Chitinophaga caeni]|uniref:Thioredoxin domain-containing protein n=1 Tax=Chitinophaga caeni TaxID=2029983 RepID=A0A291QWM4_9BACT|nr:TlpA disulfide reductase family protein [Chitinophaga caeni]ATL48330.1 hypothetical protein COR50_14800 [Chitinophaga caeni]
MKRFVLKSWMPLALLASPITMLAQQNKIVKSITVKGKVQFRDPRTKEQKIWLMKESLVGKPTAVDSCLLKEDNSFTFTLKQDHQGVYSIDALHWDHATFWSDADVKVSMRGYDTARYKVKVPHYNYVEGSYDNNFVNMSVLNSELNYRRMIDEYNMQYYAKKSTDSAFNHYLETRTVYNPLSKDFETRQEILIRSYQDRPVAIYAIRGMAGTEAGEKYDRALSMLDVLIGKYPWLTEAKDLKKNIIFNMEQAQKLKAGKPMPSISYPTPGGQLANLEKYKGKYLLVDFWASWCGPCRQAIPKVKELYETYKEKGFAVVSISIDTDEKAWRKAMKDENMPWEQMLSSNKDETMKTFQFSGIPTLYLVDPEGNIINKYTGFTDEAHEKIENAIKNKEKAPKAVRSASMSSF